jgi:hypothetical protein
MNEKEIRLNTIEACMAIVQQTLDGMYADAEEEPESKTLKVSIAAREHVLFMLNGYRMRVKAGVE